MVLGNDQVILAHGKGNIETTKGTLMDVLYVPDICVNLFSVLSATLHDVYVRYNRNGVTLCKRDEIITEGYILDKSYVVEFEVFVQNAEVSYVARTLDQLHECLAHVSKTTIRSMIDSGIVEGIQIKQRAHDDTCLNCALNKGHLIHQEQRRRPQSQGLFSISILSGPSQ